MTGRIMRTVGCQRKKYIIKYMLAFYFRANVEDNGEWCIVITVLITCVV